MALLRVLGKRGLGQLSGFDLVIIVALGAAVGDPMFQEEVPLIKGMLVISAVVALERILVKVTDRSQTAERLVESTPVLLVRDGVVLTDALDREDLSQDEVFMRLREEGVESLGEVKRAYLETSGNISVLKKSRPSSGLSILPAE